MRLTATAAVAIAVAGAAAAAACSLVVDTAGLSSGSDASAVPLDGSPPGDASALGDVAVTASSEGGVTEGGSSDCPGKGGPAMVRVRDSHGTFCIDTTEVTNAQFDAMLTALPSSLPARSPTCSFKGPLALAKALPPKAPRVLVDWCDAELFCAWAGKRFCGSRDGTVIDNGEAANKANVDEWFAACSKDETRKYPYGSGFDDKACNGCARTGACGGGAGSPLVEVASLRGCEGGYPGLFDMTGNAAEWMDDCDQNGGGDRAKDHCPPKGGDRNTSKANLLACAFVDNGDLAVRDAVADDIGFRCCAD